MTTTTPDAGDATVLPVRTLTMAWALKRTAMGIVILFVVVFSAAWLLHASIDPRLEAGSATAAPLQTTAANKAF